MASYKNSTDFYSLAQSYIPTILARTRFVGLVFVLIDSISYLYYSLFLEYYTAVELDLAITPQVCVMEKYLNERFDPTLKRIYIEDGIQYPVTYVFLRVEDKPVFVYLSAESTKKYLGLRSESGFTSVSFRVRIPATLTPAKETVRAWVQKYKLASKNFDVIEI